MNYVRRIQELILNQLFKGKLIVLYGPRRVGKTFLSKQILQKYKNTKYVNCELLQYKAVLETTNSELLNDFFTDLKLVVLDEAQHIKNIGLTLKILVDTFPKLQVIATGSSSFDLANKITEPLTGRTREYLLLPFSFEEIKQKYDTPTLLAKIPNLLRFGLYPDVFDKSEADSREEIMNIASNYLYKDVLQFESVRKPDLVLNLLKALALQLGSEVSYSELSKLLGQNIPTIKRYIDLLEKNFIIFKLKSFSRNLRKEIAKGQKIYFYDIGICNALLNNFNLPDFRKDKGGLWENFCIVERIKRNNNNRIFAQTYFMRTYTKKEIDYIEEIDEQLNCFEFKYKNTGKVKPPKEFLETYENTSFKVIDSENIFEFLR